MPEVRFQPTVQRGMSSAGRTGLLIFFLALIALAFSYKTIQRQISQAFTESEAERLNKLDAEAKRNPNSEWVVIPVAARDIPAFTRIQLHMLERAAKPREAINKGGQFTELGSVLNRVPLQDVPAGFAFTEGMLAPPKTREGIAAGIPPGWGAISLPKHRVQGQIENLRVGDKVALLASVADSDAEDDAALGSNVAVVSKLARVLKPLNVVPPKGGNQSTFEQLIATHDAKKNADDKAEEITLAMPSEDIIRLAQVDSKARLQMLLMSNQGSELELEVPVADTEPVADTALPGATTKLPARPEWEVEVIRGSKRSLQQVGAN